MFHRIVLAAALLALAPCWNAKAETEAQRKACANDAQVHCPDAIPDRDRTRTCLVEKINQLTPACRKVINDAISGERTQQRR